MKREFITHHIHVDMVYHNDAGVSIPYGQDIIIFFPEGSFEYLIADGSNNLIRKQIHNEGPSVRQVNISFLQYINISQNPKLHIKSLKEKSDFQLMVVFTTL